MEYIRKGTARRQLRRGGGHHHINRVGSSGSSRRVRGSRFIERGGKIQAFGQQRVVAGEIGLDGQAVLVRHDMRLEVGRLREALVAPAEGTHVRTITWEGGILEEFRGKPPCHTCMNAEMGAQVKVQRKVFATSFEGTLKNDDNIRTTQMTTTDNTTHLERLLARVHQLMALEFARLHERLAALATDVRPRPVRVQVLAHCTVVAKHLVAARVRAFDRLRLVQVHLFLLLWPGEFKQTNMLGSSLAKTKTKYSLVRR